MEVAGWVCSLAALLSLMFTVTHSHREKIDTFRVSAGHLFLLKCLIGAAHTNVTWSRGGKHNQSLPAGVEVRDGLLWFLPLQMSHNGTYNCEIRTEDKLLRMELGVSVSSGECPDPADTKPITQGVSRGVSCQQNEIIRLNKTQNIRWLKDCQPVKRQGEPISVEVDGTMRLPRASERDSGKYTCLVDVDLDGRSYTSARSIQLNIDNDPRVSAYPEVVYPQETVNMVEVGARVDLKCVAYIGVTKEDDASVYWTVDGDFTEDHEELDVSQEYNKVRGRVYILSTLSISKVPRKFLNVPIRCHVKSPVGEKDGVVWLQEADHSALYTNVAVCLAATLTLLALAAALLFFKVDLVLASREVMRHFSKSPDGKLYDAFVSYLHPDTLSSAESFALQILPEKLEKQHGYSLYIRGRDDCPGEAMHDLIAYTVQRCRRLIIILSAEAKSSTDGKTEEACPIHNDQNQLCYEQKVGLHDALTQNEPRVILVEIDGLVDYSHLPESLHFIKRKQGALKWKTTSLGTHKLNSNRHFWKNLRYHMPSVPAGTQQTVV
ncbi:interleukin-1 receptor type 1-like [Thunnus thynnus]|uniref:interleukin-1 receptor type 1-like n=1 Tax=Thunnus thynnus TaxID=8237 RepID=UPI003526D056